MAMGQKVTHRRLPIDKSSEDNATNSNESNEEAMKKGKRQNTRPYPDTKFVNLTFLTRRKFTCIGSKFSTCRQCSKGTSDYGGCH